MYQYTQKIVAMYDSDPNNHPRLMELLQVRVPRHAARGRWRRGGAGGVEGVGGGGRGGGK